MGNERTCVQAIQTTAAEYHPLAVGRPGMITVRIRAVRFFCWNLRTRAQVEHAQIRIFVPDREGSVRCRCTKQIFSVWRDTGKQNALPFCFRLKDRVDNRTESPAFRIKRNAAKAITKVTQFARNFQCRGGTKVKLFSIR